MPFTDIPKSVTLQNFTKQKQMLDFGYLIPPMKVENGVTTPGELTIDLTKLSNYRREKVWEACNNAHAGEVIKIKA